MRPATPSDRVRLGQMAGRLVRLHHSLDPKRFIALEPVEEGYGRWLVRELSRREALVLVAERVDGGIVGYVYGTLEDQSYQDLRGECGYLHDLWVEDHARRAGIATALVEQACALFTARGAPRVVLMAASRNPAAHALFARLGFRDTMVEMTRELRAE